MDQECQTHVFNTILLLTIYMYGSCLYQSISKVKRSYLPGTFPRLKPYSHFYYNYSTIYSCFNHNFQEESMPITILSLEWLLKNYRYRH